MDKVLKQRLVGASILIALAVIFLPMLFNDDRDERIEQRELALDVPERDEGDRRIRRLSLDPAEARRPGSEPPAEAGEGAAEAGPQAIDDSDPQRRPVARSDAGQETDEGDARTQGEDGARSDDDTSREARSTQTTPDPVESESEAESETAAGAEAETDSGEAVAPQARGDWVVQVAVFGNVDTAASIRERLEELGHEVMVDVMVRNQAELHRLRTGPYASEEDAGRARDQIAATVAGVEPAVRDLEAATGAVERQGMAVQVGSFASRNNAERLVGQLAEAGYDAFMHGEVSGGRTIWRVRVGTFATREEAERLLETLNEEEGLQGIVVSHP